MNGGLFPISLQKKHSTETTLLCVTNALKAAMDNRQGMALVPIDFSVAFDTINHKIMIQPLRLCWQGAQLVAILPAGLHPANDHS